MPAQSGSCFFLRFSYLALVMVEQPEIPLLTIGNSIMMTGRYHPLVTRVIREEFARIGLQPKLKVETHSNELCGAPGAIVESPQQEVAAA